MKLENIKKRKRAKNFYSSGFKKAVNALGLSVLLNLILLGGINHRYVTRPAEHFYATNGVTMPEQVMPLNAPNMLSTPLLSDDTPGEMMIRQLPDDM